MKIVTEPPTGVSQAEVESIGCQIYAVVADIVAAPGNLTTEEKAKIYLAAITQKCLFCRIKPEQDEVTLGMIADCVNQECPLRLFGPMVLKIFLNHVAA